MILTTEHRANPTFLSNLSTKQSLRFDCGPGKEYFPLKESQTKYTCHQSL